MITNQALLCGSIEIRHIWYITTTSTRLNISILGKHNRCKFVQYTNQISIFIEAYSKYQLKQFHCPSILAIHRNFENWNWKIEKNLVLKNLLPFPNIQFILLQFMKSPLHILGNFPSNQIKNMNFDHLKNNISEEVNRWHLFDEDQHRERRNKYLYALCQKFVYIDLH